MLISCLQEPATEYSSSLTRSHVPASCKTLNIPVFVKYMLLTKTWKWG